MKRNSVKKLDSGVKIFDTPGESGKYHLFDSKSFSYFGTLFECK